MKKNKEMNLNYIRYLSGVISEDVYHEMETNPHIDFSGASMNPVLPPGYKDSFLQKGHNIYKDLGNLVDLAEKMHMHYKLMAAQEEKLGKGYMAGVQAYEEDAERYKKIHELLDQAHQLALPHGDVR